MTAGTEEAVGKCKTVFLESNAKLLLANVVINMIHWNLLQVLTELALRLVTFGTPSRSNAAVCRNFLTTVVQADILDVFRKLEWLIQANNCDVVVNMIG